MEISRVRQRVRETIERAKRAAADRRMRNDEAGRDFDVFLEQIAVPLFQQVASALRADNYPFTVFTPAGSVRLKSDRSATDYIELILDTTGPLPQLLVHASRSRGSRVIETETPIDRGKDAAIGDLTDEQLLAVVLHELELFVER